MERMTLREASERTARSITTLRRYIRSGRLHAEKRDGRFGPEYYVSRQDLAGAGLEHAPVGNDPAAQAVGARRDSAASEGAAGRGGGPGLLPIPQNSGALAEARAAVPFARTDGVPIGLYRELQMKHEQLLVQYGMIRAGGMRALEQRTETEGLKRQLDQRNTDLERLRRRSTTENGALKRELRAAHLELEGRGLQIAALEEKVRALEMLTRNTATSESIEKQYRDVMDQSRKVGQIRAADKWQSPASRPVPQGIKPPEH